MAQKKITFGIGFNADLSGLNQLKTQLQALSNMSWVDAKKLNISNQELIKMRNETAILADMFSRSYNIKLNSLNVTKFKQELEASGRTLQSVGNNLKKFGLDGEMAFLNLTNEIAKTKTEIKQTNQFLDNMSKTFINTIRWSIASTAINKVTGSIQKAYSFSKQLDESLNDIRIVTGKSAEEMDRFAVRANKAAAQLGKTTKDYTTASLLYYQQGLSDKDVQSRTNVTLKAANVTGQSTSEVSEQLTAIWNGYKVSAQEAETYIDKVAAVAATTASNLEELSTGMSKVASAANAMGVDIDQLNAQLSTIISVTRQDAGVAGTALKTIYARMTDIESGLDTETTLGRYTSEMAQFGIQVLDAKGGLRDVGEVMEEIGGKWNTFTREQQVALAQAMAGTRQYNNLMALFGNWDMYTKSLETSKTALGTLQNQQDIYMESLEAHIEQLTASQEKLYSSLFDSSAFKGFVDTMSFITGGIGQLIKNVGGAIPVFTALFSIITRIFNKQIAMEISRINENITRGKYNIQQFNDKLEQLTAAKGFNQLTDAVIDTTIEIENMRHAGLITAEEEAAAKERVQNMSDYAQAILNVKKAREQALQKMDVDEEGNKVVDFNKVEVESEKAYEQYQAQMKKDAEKGTTTSALDRLKQLQAAKTAHSEAVKNNNNIKASTEKDYTELQKRVAEENIWAEENDEEINPNTPNKISLANIQAKRSKARGAQQSSTLALNKTKTELGITNEEDEQQLANAAMVETIQNYDGNFDALAESLGPVIENTTLANTQLGQFLQIYENLTTSMSDNEGVIDNFVDSLSGTGDPIKDIEESFNLLTETADKVGDDIRVGEKTKEEYDKAKTAIEEFINKHKEDINSLAPQEQAELNKIAKQYKAAYTKAEKEVKDSLDHQSQLVVNAANQELTQKKKLMEAEKNRQKELKRLAEERAKIEKGLQIFSDVTTIISAVTSLKNAINALGDANASLGEKIGTVVTTFLTLVPLMQRTNLIASIASKLKKNVAEATVEETAAETAVTEARVEETAATTEATTAETAAASAKGETAAAATEEAVAEVVDAEAKNDTTVAATGEAVAENVDTGAKNKNTIATHLASIAQGIFNAQMGVTLAVLAVLVVAILGAVAAYKAISDWVHRYENNLKDANETAEKATERYHELTDAYDKLKESIEDYKDAQDAIDNLATGTQEWKEAIADANKQVLELINTYPKLAKYINKDNSGRMTIAQEGFDELLRAQEEKIEKQYLATLGAETVKQQASMANTIHNSKLDTKLSNLASNSSYTLSEDDINSKLQDFMSYYADRQSTGTFDEIYQQYIDSLDRSTLEGQSLAQTLSLVSADTKKDLKDLSESLLANTEALKQTASTSMGAYNEANGGLDYANSNVKNAINDLQSEEYLEQLKIFEEEWKDKSGGHKDSTAQKEYADLMGYRAYKNKSGNIGSYLQDDGTWIDIPDKEARQAIAVSKAQKAASSKAGKTAGEINKVAQMAGKETAQQQVLMEYRNKNQQVIWDQMNQFEAEDLRNNIAEKTDEQLASLAELFDTTAEELRKNIQNDYELYKTSWEDALGNLINLTDKDGKQIFTDENNNLSKINITNAKKLNELYTSADENMQQILTNILSSAEGNINTFIEGLDSFQFSIANGLDVDIANFTSYMEDLGVAFDNLEDSGSMASFISWIRGLKGELISFQELIDKQQGTSSILSKITKKGDTITFKDYQDLIDKGQVSPEFIEKYFDLTFNGYAFKGNVDQMWADIIGQFNEQITSSNENYGKTAGEISDYLTSEYYKNADINSVTASQSNTYKNAILAQANLARNHLLTNYTDQGNGTVTYEGIDQRDIGNFINYIISNGLITFSDDLVDGLNTIGDKTATLTYKQLADYWFGEGENSPYTKGKAKGASYSSDFFDADGASVYGETSAAASTLLRYIFGNINDSKLIEYVAASFDTSYQNAVDNAYTTAENNLTTNKNKYKENEESKKDFKNYNSFAGLTLSKDKQEIINYEKSLGQVEKYNNKINNYENKRLKLLNEEKLSIDDIVENYNDQYLIQKAITSEYEKQSKYLKGRIQYFDIYQGMLQDNGLHKYEGRTSSLLSTLGFDITTKDENGKTLPEKINEAIQNGNLGYLQELLTAAYQNYTSKIGTNAEAAAKAAYDILNDNISDYSQLIQDSITTDNNILDSINKEMELAVASLKEKLTHVEEIVSIAQNYNNFLRELNKDNYAQIASSYISDFKNRIFNLNTLYETEKSIRNDERLTEQEKINQLKEINEKIQSETLSLQENLKNIEQSRLDIATAMNDQYSKQINYLDMMKSAFNHQINVTKMLYGEKDYKRMTNYYTGILEKSQSILLANDNIVAQMKSAYEDAQKFNDPEIEAQALENYTKALQDQASSIEEVVNAAQEVFKNTVYVGFQTFIESLNGANIEQALSQANWEYEFDNKYMSDRDRELNIANLGIQYQKEMSAYAGDAAALARLNALRKTEIDLLKEKEYLNKNDISLAQKRLELEKARIDLEYARSDTSTLRLTRGANGEYSYQYVANEDNVLDKMKRLNELELEYSQLVKQSINESVNTYDSLMGIIEQIAEATTDEERQDLYNRFAKTLSAMSDSLKGFDLSELPESLFNAMSAIADGTYANSAEKLQQEIQSAAEKLQEIKKEMKDESDTSATTLIDVAGEGVTLTDNILETLGKQVTEIHNLTSEMSGFNDQLKIARDSAVEMSTAFIASAAALNGIDISSFGVTLKSVGDGSVRLTSTMNSGITATTNKVKETASSGSDTTNTETTTFNPQSVVQYITANFPGVKTVSDIIAALESIGTESVQHDE